MRRSARFLSAALLAAALPLAAADFHAGPEDYLERLATLQPGDRLLLRAGDYTRGLPLRDLNGEVGQPIVIEGPSQGPRARFIARRGAHTVSLIDVSHVIVRHLQLDGTRLPVDAVRAEGHARYAHFVTLENLHIHDHDASQQNVGISTKAPAYGWVVRGNLIERVGTGMYFGDSDGSDPFVAGLIEDNHIRATLGYNLQIKHQAPRPAGLPGAGTAHTTVIRRNLFDKRDGGPLGPMARPNLLVGHWPLAGDGADDRYLIHANLFWHNPGEALFQGEGRFALYNNLFITDGPDAIRVQPHNDVPRDVRVLFNTVLAAGNGITVLAPDANPYTQRVAGNLVFAARPLRGGAQQANLTGARTAAARHLAHPDQVGDTPAEAARALAPRDGRAPARRLDPAWLADLPDIGLDFAGRPRPPGTIGALVGPRRRRPAARS